MTRRRPSRVRKRTVRVRRVMKPRRAVKVDAGAHLGLVKKLVGQKLNILGARANPDLRQEMESAGNEALVRAARNYNPKRSAFTTVAHRHISFAINEVLNKQGPTKFSKKGFVKYRRAGGELHTKAPLEGLDFGPDARSSGGGLESSEVKLRIGSLLKRLPARDQKVMVMHAQDVPQKKIAKAMKLTPARVNQIIKRSQMRMLELEAA